MRCRHLGVRHIDMPLTPEKIWKLIQQGGQRMIPQDIRLHRAGDAGGSLALLADGGAKLLAGGMSLIPLMKLRLAAPESIWSIWAASRISTTSAKQGGAIAHRRHGHASRRRKLAAGARQVPAAGRDRRPRSATCRCATWAPSAAASRMPIRRPIIPRRCWRSKRRSSFAERRVGAHRRGGGFLLDAFTTALEPGEIVREIVVPVEATATAPAIRKWLQPASGFAIVGVAARVRSERRQDRVGAHRRHGSVQHSRIGRRRRRRLWKGRRAPPADIAEGRGAGGARRGRQLRSARFGRLPQAPGERLRGARDRGRACLNVKQNRECK